MHTKAGFSQVPVPGYLPSSYDLEQTDADQIIQMVNEEVASTDKEMQVIMQSDNKHPHINKSGSFSRLRSFKLNDMGFSLNRISPITFDVENPQTPANHGTKGRAPTSMPREKRVPQNAQQGQTYDEVVNMNEAHHEPQGSASYNPDESVTNKHTFQNVQGRFVPPKVSNMPTQPQQQQQSSSEEGSKENTILNGPRHQKEMGAQDHPSGPADSAPQGPAPTAPTHTSQTGGPPQAPPVNNQNMEGCQKCDHHQYMPQDHQDLPECNGTTNGSTRVPGKSGKGPGPTKGKSKMSEPHPGTSSGTGSTAQPAGSSKNTIVCSACGKSGHWSKNCPYYNFCDVCKVTTHSTHMCRASKHGNTTARSPVCIYCGKTNHGSAYCRYRLRDNCEEPRNTPDALRTGTAGENLAPAPRNQTRSAPHNNNNVPFSHSDGRAQDQPNRGQLGSQPRGQYNGSQQGPKHRDQTSAAPRGQQTGTNPSFPPRGQQHTHFNEGFNRRYSPPTFPSPGFNNTMASDAVGRSIIQLVENQSHSLDFILAGQQSQMDAYKEMTCSNQAREDDALFAGIQVYDGEDPSCFEGWLDAVKQACNMTDRNLRKELMKKSTGAIRETLSMMNPYWTDDDIISKLRQDFSSMSTMNRAREELKDLKQLPSQPISSYMYKYGRIHFLATGNQA